MHDAPLHLYDAVSLTIHIIHNYYTSVSPGLNEVRGAHDDKQQSAQPGARREARVARREKAHHASRRLQLKLHN